MCFCMGGKPGCLYIYVGIWAFLENNATQVDPPRMSWYSSNGYHNFKPNLRPLSYKKNSMKCFSHREDQLTDRSYIALKSLSTMLNHWK